MEAILEKAWTPSTQAESQPKAARSAVRILFFINGALFATWASRIPAVQAQRGLSNGTLGLALLAVALGAVVAMPIAGLLIARIGSARLCRISALCYCAALPAVVLMPHQALFVVALFCFGASHGALDVAMNAQAVAVEQRYREPIMSSFHALWSTGGLVGAATGGLLAASGLTPLAHFGLIALGLCLSSLLVFRHLLETGEPGSRLWFWKAQILL
jgi:predicted MFS family arabinose efflux permease